MFTLKLTPFLLETIDGALRKNCLVYLNSGVGEIAPLSTRSEKNLDEHIDQCLSKKKEIENIHSLEDLYALNLYPALLFALESAFLMAQDPIKKTSIKKSAFLMGSYEEILSQASFYLEKGFVSAKLKLSHLSLSEAEKLVYKLKDQFSLRLDFNQSLETSEALTFFDAFPLSTFDYVEEPLKNPQDLSLIRHPIGIDESLYHHFSLDDLSHLSSLKALVYKPSIQGGYKEASKLLSWCKKSNCSFVLSSAYESATGLHHIANMARRLDLSEPLGIGTYYLLKRPSILWEDL